MSTAAERRRSPRRTLQQPLTIKVIESSTRAIAPGHTVQAQTTDVSETGVRVRLLNAVPVGAELELWIISPVQRETLVMSGQVCWCLSAPDDATLHQAGIEISKRPTADFQKWKKLVAGLARA